MTRQRLPTTKSSSSLAQLIASVWMNEDAGLPLLRHPKQALLDANIVIPEEMQIVCQLDNINTLNFVLPTRSAIADYLGEAPRQQLVWYYPPLEVDTSCIRYFSPVRIPYASTLRIFQRAINDHQCAEKPNMVGLEVLANEGIRFPPHVHSARVWQNTDTFAYLVIPQLPPGAFNARELVRASSSIDWLSHASFVKLFASLD